MAQVTYSLKIDAEADPDLVHWLDRQPNKSAAIREALRAHVRGAGATLADVLAAVRDLERKVGVGGAIVRDPREAGAIDEPPEAAAALDAPAEMGR